VGEYFQAYLQKIKGNRTNWRGLDKI
jgi:hypothetical protein